MAPAGASPPMLAVQTQLYAFGPFFTNPWKPLLNAVAGDSYAVGSKHFLEDHTDPVNLALHVVCLLFQVSGNFCLLAVLDDTLLGQAVGWRVLSWSSMLVWCATLAMSPAPRGCTVLSIATIGAAFLAAPWLSARGALLEACMLVLFAAVLAVASLVITDAKARVPFKEWLPKAGTFFAIWVSSMRALDKMYGGVLAEHATVANAALAAVMLVVASRPDPVAPSVAAGATLSRVLAVLTGQPALFFYGCAYFAMALQGLAHHYGREQGTLPRLQSGKDRHAKIRYEMSHVVFFPNLLMQACAAALAGKNRKKNKKQADDASSAARSKKAR